MTAPSESLRVGIVLPNFGGGGAEFVAHEWASYLQDLGHEVVVFLTHPRVEDLSSPITTVSIAGRGPWMHVLRLREELCSRRVDVVLSLMPYFNVVNLLASLSVGRLRRPAIVISGRNVDAPFRRLFGPKFLLLESAGWLLYRRADAFVAISHPVAAEAIARYRVPSEVTYVVLNPALAKVERSTARSFRDLSGASDGVLSLVVPARLVPQKRPEIALEAAAILRESGRSVRVVYFGVGPCHNDVLERAKQLGVDVDMRGWVKEWFAECPPRSVVLLPSIVEGFGNVLVEAAAVGIPSVASSRCLGAADAIVNGITGDLCMGDGPADFASAIERVASLRVSADAWVDRFRAQRSGDDLLRVLRDACATRR